MDKYYPEFRHEHYPGATWPVIASGLWLRVGFVGASAVLVAVLRAIDGEASVLSSLVMALAGAAVAALAWRQGWNVLDRADVTAPQSAPAADLRSDDVRPAYSLRTLQTDMRHAAR